MQYYKLEENEVVLYKGDIISNHNTNSRLVLTNLNIIFIENINSQNETDANVEVYPITDIKIYEGIPQVKTNAKNVEIYLKSTEKEFSFNSKNELHKFVNSTNKLITGKSKLERGANIVKNTINVVNDAVGFDVVKTTGKIVNTVINPMDKLTTPINKLKKSILHKKNK